MSFLLSPPQSPRQDDSGDDGLDNLLKSFYRAQMPDPWPAMEAPAERRVFLATFAPPRRRQSLLRSRLALAASLALLVGGSWWLLQGSKPTAGSAPATVEAGPGIGAASANGADRNPPMPVHKNGDRPMPMDD
jgi:hypothetical protein